MPLSITIEDLSNVTQEFTYQNFGDYYEQQHGQSVIDAFPNSERFWKLFVTPTTKRVDVSIQDPNIKIRYRENIAVDLQDLFSIHYSTFMNLVYAAKSLNDKQLSYFQNFYAHLGSTCDLAEEFITKLYFLLLECEEKETTVLQRLSKKKFLEIAKDWYDKHYPSTFEHYLSKGKSAPIKLISRANILKEYFSDSPQWKNYSKTALEIRTYRNVIVHNTQVANYIVNSQYFVPKRKKIGDYKKWHQVFSVTQERFIQHFTERDQQMKADLDELKAMLNSIWEKPINDLNKIFYSDRNGKLLSKYDIVFQNNDGI